MSRIQVWLDDERPAPEGWLHLKTAQDAIRLIQTGRVAKISLDHDLGPPEAGNGYQVATFMEECAAAGSIPEIIWDIHSANPVGRKKMEQALDRASGFWAKRQAKWIEGHCYDNMKIKPCDAEKLLAEADALIREYEKRTAGDGAEEVPVSRAQRDVS